MPNVARSTVLVVHNLHALFNVFVYDHLFEPDTAPYANF